VALRSVGRSVRGPVALSIAGSDSGGGAGATADLKVFEALGVWGTVAITAMTAQNTAGVLAMHLVPPSLIAAQISAVASDIGVDAAKTGMLGSAAAVRAVVGAVGAAGISRLVVDPVLVSSHGTRLLADDALAVVRAELVPLATVITPNVPEAEALIGFPVVDRDGMVAAAAALLRLGPSAVLVKGGHLADESASPDLLCTADGAVQWLEGPRLAALHTHGTGCVLSAAITAYLAIGASVPDACRDAKAFVTGAIAAGRPLGSGTGPVDPGWATGAGGLGGR
jgi:hydroxymethylpyrimidine/phosphomethylpyrimidine kinase